MADRIGNTATKAYVIGDTTKKYYKWVPWEQPVMTSNTMYGNLKGSSQHAVSKVGTRYYYRMFDKDTTTTDGRINHWGPSNVVKAWWCWELPVQLKVTKITIYGESYYSSAADWSVVGQFYTDATKSTKIGDELVIEAQGQVKEIVIPDGIIVTALYFDKTGGGAYGGFDQIDIEATTPVEVAPGEDYDFTTDQPVIKLPGYKQKRKYYKRVFRPWDYKPALTSNTSDPNFIVSASSQLNGDYAIWKSFAASKNLAYPWFTADGKTTGWYQIKTRDKIALKYVKTQNRNASPGFMKTFYIEGSNDGEHWTQLTPILHNPENAVSAFIDIPVGSTEAYYYHRFTILSSHRSDIVSIGFPTLYADEEYNKYEVSSDDDWDFYEDYDYAPHAVTYRQERYFKRGDEINATPVGSPSVEGTILKGATAANCFLLPKKYPVGDKSWELQLKVMPTSLSDQQFLGGNTVGAACIEAGIRSSKWVWWLGANNAHTITSAQLSSATPVLSQWYVIKLCFDNKTNTYSFKTSTHDQEFVTEMSVGSIYKIGADVLSLGVDKAGATLGQCYLDFKECYFKVGDEIVWRGTHPVECSEEEAEWSDWININKPIN